MNSLLKCLADPIERHRNTTLNIFNKILKEIKIENKILIKTLILSIIDRLDHLPFPESSEEIRLKLVKLLEVLLADYKTEFKPVIAEVAKMIAVALKDAFPDMKQSLSKFISNVSLNLKEDIGPHTKQIVDSLCLNLKHQHNKIRKITVVALTDLLLTDNAGICVDDCIPSLTLISTDKNLEVRKTFLTSIAKLIKGLNIIYLKNDEAKLVYLLMSGVSDEKEEIQKMTLELLEEVGNNRLKLALELKEDVEGLYKKCEGRKLQKIEGENKGGV